MTGSPADHPAVANPQVVAATGQVLATPFLAAPGVVGQANAPVPNNLMGLLRDLFPDGSMNQVVIKNMNDNPNPIATATMNNEQYAAWTQSRNLIYVCDKYFDDYDIFNAFMLKHEAEHVIQFKNSSTGPPTSFKEMLSFEVGAYSRTWKWIDSPLGKKDLAAAGFEPNGDEKEEYDAVVKIAKDAAAGVAWQSLSANGRRLGRVLVRGVNGIVRPIIGAQLIPANPLQNSADYYFDNMASNDMIPPPKSQVDANGNVVLDAQGNPVPLRYQSRDMYLQKSDAGFAARMKALRFPI